MLLLTVHDIATGLNSSKQIDVIALDFTLGLDTVSHSSIGFCINNYITTE